MKDLNIAHAGVLVGLLPIALQLLDGFGIHLTADCVKEFWVAGISAVGTISLYLAHNKAAGLTPLLGAKKK